jgi:hypothetical protein
MALFVGMLIFLAVASVIVYRRQQWRLAEFMFLMITASIVPGCELRWLVEHEWDTERTVDVMLPLTLGCYGLAIGGGAIGLRYIKGLEVEATVPRLLLMIYGILLALSIPAIAVATVYVISNATRRGGVRDPAALYILAVVYVASGFLWITRLALRSEISRRGASPP